MNRSAAHTALVRSILAAIGAEPDVLVSMNESGRARYMGRDGSEWFVPYGYPTAEGGPDLLILLAPRGRLVGLEVKTGSGVTTSAQRAAHEAMRRFGALVYVVRSVDDARRALEDARRRSAA